MKSLTLGKVGVQGMMVMLSLDIVTWVQVLVSRVVRCSVVSTKTYTETLQSMLDLLFVGLTLSQGASLDSIGFR